MTTTTGRPVLLALLCTVIGAAAFAVDVLLPPEVATGVLYAAIVLLGLWFPKRAVAPILAVASTVVAVAGLVASPDPPLPEGWPVLANRCFSIVGIWLVAVLTMQHRSSIEALRRGQAELREREVRLQAILDTTPESIIVIDGRNTIQSFSSAAEAVFGYHAAEVVGRNVSLLMPSPDGEALDSHLAIGQRRITGTDRVVKGRRKDGALFPLELTVGEAASANGPHFVRFVRDLSVKERMEQELRQAQKMELVGQLTGGIAHDFNNLLTVILGNLEMLDARLESESERVLLREAVEAAELGAQLTGRLLAFARRQPLDPQPVRLDRQLVELGAVLRRTLGETIEVRIAVPPGLAEALVDPGQLQTALLNLALNARDAMPEGGRLGIEAAAVELDGYETAHADVRAGHYVMVAVSDTGSGMSPEVQKHAFEPFFTTKAPGAGTGLGLSIVYGFIKQSGGHAQIYSEPGHGTTVRLYLPRAPERRAPADPAPVRACAPAFPARGETVLVAEDDPRVRRVAAARLKDLGYHVLEAKDGPQALRCLEEDPNVDLLFTDMVMPGGMAGVDLAGRARDRLPALKVVYTSGYAAPDLLRRGIAEGAMWLRKPYTALELAHTLRAVLDGHPLPGAAGSPAPNVGSE